jgi:hypothetical protein
MTGRRAESGVETTALRPVTDAQRKELARRRRAHARNPSAAKSCGTSVQDSGAESDEASAPGSFVTAERRYDVAGGVPVGPHRTLDPDAL